MQIFTHILPVHHPIELIGKQDRSTTLLGSGNKGQLALDLTLADYYGGHLLDNPGLFAGNFFERIAQELGMIPTDVGDDTDQRTDHIGRIESAAHTHLNDRHIDLLTGKVIKSDGRGDFKE